MNKLVKGSLRFIVVGLLAGSMAQAATIYQNGTTDAGVRFNPGILEVGDEVNFAGTERLLTQFSFEYYGLTDGGTFANVQARVRFYNNNGDLVSGYAAPGTMFYDSQWFNVSTTPRSTLIFTPGQDNLPVGLVLPDKMTWTVQFQNLGFGDEAGLDVYDPVAIGSSQDDYWQKEGGIWTLKVNSAGNMNFGAQFDAIVVPEPTAFALFALGMLALGIRRK